MTTKPEINAGKFAAWLDRFRDAQKEKSGMEVPCGECTACCTSSQFIHIRPDETDTLEHIPNELLFPAPGLSDGHVLLGYDKNCAYPMLVDAKCSIYEHRPITYRTYDCRVFAATGISPGEKDHTLIAEQSRRCVFDATQKQDSNAHSAVRDAARFLQTHAKLFPDGFLPHNETQLAVLAIKVSGLFQRDGAA